jgi:serine/threonine protein phosphatase PrpC
MLRISAAVASHPGLRRQENEDAYCVRPDLGLCVVADGMGGHAAGEVASRVAVDAIEAFVSDTHAPDSASAYPHLDSQSSEGDRLHAALRLANKRIGAAIAEDGALKGMATTAAALLVGATHLTIAHVGDSRIYRGRRGHWEQLTDDHSWVSEQLRAGVMSESEASRHPWRHIVTRALSGGEDPVIDVADVAVEDGDELLICSDGLSNMVPPDALAAILSTTPSQDAACAALIDAANAAGGPDNITVVLVRVHVD